VLPVVYTQPAAASLFGAACLIWLLPELVAMRGQMAHLARRTAAVQDRGSLVLLVALQSFGLFADFFLAWRFPAAAIPARGFSLVLVGVLFILVGVALRWFAIRTLGRYFTRDVAVSADQVVVESGPYRLVRHPAYSGTFLTMLGVALALGNWAGLLSLLLAVFVGHMHRVQIEEQVLAQNIGQAYVDYMRRTKRFIPLLF
jgi:protein-S-isoprenylcysteine O-methyltransferase Ste14